MRPRTRALLLVAFVGLLLAIAILALAGVRGDREAPVASGRGADLSLRDQERIYDRRIQLSNFCFAAIKTARDQGSTPPVPEAGSQARGTVDELLRLARENPDAYVDEIGSMRTVLTGAALDLEDPACLPDESRRLREAAARLPE
jgi:hypothetical protein